jgi:hypothetical protein
MVWLRVPGQARRGPMHIDNSLADRWGIQNVKPEAGREPLHAFAILLVGWLVGVCFPYKLILLSETINHINIYIDNNIFKIL